MAAAFRSSRRLITGLALAAIALLLTACGRGVEPAETPDAALTAFDEAMRAGDPDTALAYVDFDAWARRTNPDWDSLPASQRNLITGRQLEALKTWTYPADGLTAEPAVIDGRTANAVASTGGVRYNLVLEQGDEGWKIVAGLPGMSGEGGDAATEEGL